MAILFLIKVTALLKPYDLYFSFGRLLYGFGGTTSVYGVILNFSIPFLVGIVLGLILRSELSSTATCSGFLSAVLLAWPILLYWENLVEPYLLDKRLAFGVIFSLYVLAFSFLSAAGGAVGIRLARSTTISGSRLRLLLDWKATIWPFFVGVLASIVATLLLRGLL